MLCKNCGYILSGKEKFCPDCAAPQKKETKETEKSTAEEKVTVHEEEEITDREYIFPKIREEEYEKKPRLNIFEVAEDKEMKEQESKKKEKSYGVRILLLLFLICLLGAATFAAADYFGITPSVLSFAQKEAAVKEKETSEGLFDHKSSVVKPDISCAPSAAVVMSGKGLTLRKGPDKSYAPVMNLSDLTEVQIYGRSAAAEVWVYVYCKEKDCYGWLDVSFLAATADEITAEESSYVQGQ